MVGADASTKKWDPTGPTYPQSRLKWVVIDLTRFFDLPRGNAAFRSSFKWDPFLRPGASPTSSVGPRPDRSRRFPLRRSWPRLVRRSRQVRRSLRTNSFATSAAPQTVCRVDDHPPRIAPARSVRSAIWCRTASSHHLQKPVTNTRVPLSFSLSPALR